MVSSEKRLKRVMFEYLDASIPMPGLEAVVVGRSMALVRPL